MKIPRFMIGVNVMADQEGLYVVHTQEPQFVAKCFACDGPVIRLGEILDKFPYGCRVNTFGNGRYYIIVVVKWLGDEPEATQESADRTAKLMSRMGDWFYSYYKNMNDGDE